MNKWTYKFQKKEEPMFHAETEPEHKSVDMPNSNLFHMFTHDSCSIIY